ncbi:hypothetical protein BV25DRAFT_835200 [Artomyces pyxidatus]|uniref:Uncharacterized protein n=1 Tax=Artomyces pyxidatus TaxID=48021 RepID=A0ACB8TGJ7_9AGAM|nr:hypothetical protein BV25DRAFT_835200 [Artomyces pyxidatus]
MYARARPVGSNHRDIGAYGDSEHSESIYIELLSRPFDIMELPTLIDALELTNFLDSESPFTHIEVPLSYSSVTAYRASNPTFSSTDSSNGLAGAPADYKLILGGLSAQEYRQMGLLKNARLGLSGEHLGYVEGGFGDKWTEQKWIEVFENCPNLQTLRVFFPSAPSMVAALSVQTMHPERGAKAFFLPTPSVLQLLFDFDLSESRFVQSAAFC